MPNILTRARATRVMSSSEITTSLSPCTGNKFDENGRATAGSAAPPTWPWRGLALSGVRCSGSPRGAHLGPRRGALPAQPLLPARVVHLRLGAARAAGAAPARGAARWQGGRRRDPDRGRRTHDPRAGGGRDPGEVRGGEPAPGDPGREHGLLRARDLGAGPGDSTMRSPSARDRTTRRPTSSRRSPFTRSTSPTWAST